MSTESNTIELLNKFKVSDNTNIRLLSDTLLKTSINDKELRLLLRILEEISSSASGVSSTYTSLLSEDFQEVPVSMKRFIEDPDYLGDFCRTLYPFWKNVLIDIVDNDQGYLEVALSGAIGIGKTHIGVILMLRCLYYLSCLRDPHKYLGVSQTIGLVFLNLTLDLAEGVGYDRFNKGAMSSPWFRRNGSIVGNKYKSYKPDKDISAIIASTNDQMIGKDVFCVAADTIVIHNEVSTRIDDIKITNESTTLGYDTNNKEFVDSSIDGIGRSYHSSSVSFEFEDGTSIEVTNNHQFLLTNGLYISASEVHNKLLNGEEVDVVSIV